MRVRAVPVRRDASTRRARPRCAARGRARYSVLRGLVGRRRCRGTGVRRRPLARAVRRPRRTGNVRRRVPARQPGPHAPTGRTGRTYGANGPRPICSRTVTTGGFVIDRRCQFAPSTTSVCPEMKRAYGDARNVAAQPSSCRWPDAQRGLAHVLVGGAVEVAANVGGHVLVREQAGHETVHLDAVRAPLDRERLGEVLHACLGRGRVHEARVRPSTRTSRRR